MSSLTLSAAIAAAEVPSAAPQPQASASGGTAAQSADQRITELSREVEDLKNLIHQAQMSKEPAATVTGTTVSPGQAPAPGATISSPISPTAVGDSGGAAAVPPKVAADLLRGMTINAMLDGYYEYNTNAPVGRVNYLRAYDVSSNSFSLNQADLMVESAPDPTTDKRAGMRLDFLPYGYTGLRAKYVVNDELAINAWITNGTEQTEAFNNYKDQLYGFVLTPTPTPAVTWTFNYYQGQEHPDVVYLQTPGPGQQNLPNQQGTYILPIANPPDGKLQITDGYVTWQVSKAITFAAEADYVQQRLYSYSTPQHVTGGALYGGYQLTPKVALAARLEYLADTGGLFSGTPQYLKEGTLTLDYRPVDGFLMRGEFRRDQSNQHYFLGSSLGVLEASQPTIGFGLVWWMGQKEGAW